MSERRFLTEADTSKWWTVSKQRSVREICDAVGAELPSMRNVTGNLPKRILVQVIRELGGHATKEETKDDLWCEVAELCGFQEREPGSSCSFNSRQLYLIAAHLQGWDMSEMEAVRGETA